MICYQCDEDFYLVVNGDRDSVRCELCDEWFCSQTCLDEHFSMMPLPHTEKDLQLLALVAEQADAGDLNSPVLLERTGSSPVEGTMNDYWKSSVNTEPGSSITMEQLKVAFEKIMEEGRKPPCGSAERPHVLSPRGQNRVREGKGYAACSNCFTVIGGKEKQNE